MNLSKDTQYFDLDHEFIDNVQSSEREGTFIFCPNVMQLTSILISLQRQFVVFILVWLVHQEYLHIFR